MRWMAVLTVVGGVALVTGCGGGEVAPANQPAPANIDTPNKKGTPKYDKGTEQSKSDRRPNPAER